MAGATNRQLKKLGFREAGIEKIRTTGGRGLSIESAISHARAHGVALPVPALLHSPQAKAPPGWQAAARGEKPKRPEKPAESLDAYRARDVASRDPATMRAAIRDQIKRVRSDAGTEADVNRLSDMLRSRNAAAKQRAAERGGQQDLFGANPAPRGPSPFEVRAKAAAERRAAMVAAASQRTGRMPQVLGGAARGMMAVRRTDRVAGSLGGTARGMLAARKATQAAAQKAAAKPALTGPRPFNLDRHHAKAQALLKERVAQVERAQKRVDSTTGAEKEKATAAMWKAIAAKDNARELFRAANARVYKREAAAVQAREASVMRAAERAKMPARTAKIAEQMAAGRDMLSTASKARAGHENVVHYTNGAPAVKAVKVLHQQGNFFVHKALGGGYAVSHRGTGGMVGQSRSISAARAMMDGMAKSGDKVLGRIRQGDSRATAAMIRLARIASKANYAANAGNKYNG